MKKRKSIQIVLIIVLIFTFNFSFTFAQGTESEYSINEPYEFPITCLLYTSGFTGSQQTVQDKYKNDEGISHIYIGPSQAGYGYHRMRGRSGPQQV